MGFWPLPGHSDDESVLAAKKRYHEAYFAEYEGVWCEHPFTFNLPLFPPHGGLISPSISIVMALDWRIYLSQQPPFPSPIIFFLEFVVWARDPCFLWVIPNNSRPYCSRYLDSSWKDHGDHVLLTESRMGNAGGLVMLGRSDGVLYVTNSWAPSILEFFLRRRRLFSSILQSIALIFQFFFAFFSS